MISFVLFFSFAFAQSDAEKIQFCLQTLYKDQAHFIKSSGHYAAHVNLLENSEKNACFGVSLKLSRQTIRDYNIQGSINDEVWQINHNKIVSKVMRRK